MSAVPLIPCGCQKTAKGQWVRECEAHNALRKALHHAVEAGAAQNKMIKALMEQAHENKRDSSETERSA